jgi:hypothetical protein
VTESTAVPAESIEGIGIDIESVCAATESVVAATESTTAVPASEASVAVSEGAAAGAAAGATSSGSDLEHPAASAEETRRTETAESFQFITLLLGSG